MCTFEDFKKAMMIKPIKWDERGLCGNWLFTYKIDGIRCLIINSQAYSRNGNKLNNIPLADDGDYEVYHGSWGATESIVMGKKPIDTNQSCLYPLSSIDSRLFAGYHTNPTAETIKDELIKANEAGYEGLVFRQGDKWIKVKPSETIDIKIEGILEGKGQFTNMLGAFVTKMGNVGSGFTVNQRGLLFDNRLIGSVIEVAFMQLTTGGKFRHPQFVRLRTDK